MPVDADPASAARRVAAIFDMWSRADHVRLHAGEMTAQEMRSVRAVLGAVRGEVEAVLAIEALPAGRGDEGRVERWARAMCVAAGHTDPDQPYADGRLWEKWKGPARAAIALADEEAAARREAERQADAITPWARASASAAAGLCMCHTCIRDRDEAPVTMHLCPECGNKRCPKASDHRLACTGSNAIGQPGSVF